MLYYFIECIKRTHFNSAAFLYLSKYFSFFLNQRTIPKLAYHELLITVTSKIRNVIEYPNISNSLDTWLYKVIVDRHNTWLYKVTSASFFANQKDNQ